MNNVNKIWNSCLFKSWYLHIYLSLRVPKQMRLNSQIEYSALNTIPNPPQNAVNELRPKTPKSITNSPIKFDVPGKLIFANVNKKKKIVNHGIKTTNPL